MRALKIVGEANLRQNGPEDQELTPDLVGLRCEEGYVVGTAIVGRAQIALTRKAQNVVRESEGSGPRK